MELYEIKMKEGKYLSETFLKCIWTCECVFLGDSFSFQYTLTCYLWKVMHFIIKFVSDGISKFINLFSIC